jgi:hypothetical protein
MDAHGLAPAAEPVWVEDHANQVCVLAPQGEGEAPAPAPMSPAQAVAKLVTVLRQLNDCRDGISSPPDEQSKKMDVNGDEILTIADAVALIEHIRTPSDAQAKESVDLDQESGGDVFTAMLEDIAAAQL